MMKTTCRIPLSIALLFLCGMPPVIAADPDPTIFELVTRAKRLALEKKWAEAEQVLKAAIRQPGVAKEEPIIANLQLQLATLYRMQEKHAEACDLAKTAMTSLEAAVGKENPYAVSSRWFAAREALAAGNAAEAAQCAAVLLATLKDYVDSGRAAAARWEEIPGFNKLGLELPGLNAAGIVELTGFTGRAMAAAGRHAEARPLLESAVSGIGKLYGSGHPDLVVLQETLETIARARGEELGRRFVGGLGRGDALVFEGNVVFSDDQLRGGLAKDIGFVLASHPAAELSDFLPVISKRLWRGYRNSGFSDPQIKAEYAADRDGGRIVIRIAEGARYVMGGIRVDGAREIDPESLRKVMMNIPDSGEHAALADRLQRTMAAQAKKLPVPGDEAGGDTPEPGAGAVPSFPVGSRMPDHLAPDKLFPEFIEFKQSGNPDWEPGGPVRFPAEGKEPLIDTVRGHLADRGRPLSRVHTSLVLAGDGTADLVITIDDEGPVAVLGEVTVLGSVRNPVEDVLAAAGLTVGAPLVPATLDKARVSLWESGRFFPFDVSLKPAKEGSGKLDVVIRVREVAMAPPLKETAAPEVECLRLFLADVNRLHANGRFTDFVMTSDPEDGPRVVFGLSAKDGTFIDYFPGKRRRIVSISPDKIDLDLDAGGFHGRVSLPGTLGQVQTHVTLLPQPESDAGAAIGWEFGYGSRDSMKNQLEFLAAPALAYVKRDKVRLEGDQVVWFSGESVQLVRLDLATHRPVDDDHTTWDFRAGAVRERQEAFAKDLDTNTVQDQIAGWVGIFRATTVLLKDEGLDFDDGNLFQRALGVSELLVNPETLRPLKELWADWRKSRRGGEFVIPHDPEMNPGSEMMNLMIGLGAITLSETFAPADSWISRLSRELVFIHGGKSQYTSRTLDELLADPEMGPVGSLATARLIEGFSPSHARGFVEKARRLANAEGFRDDWTLFLDSPAGLGKAMTGILDRLASLSSKDEKTIAGILSPRQAVWYHDFLQRLRRRPEGESVAAWIAPEMDNLWDQVLGETVRKGIEARLTPAFNPAETAAVVNGQPVPRAFVDLMTDAFPGLLDSIMPPMDDDPDREWTKDPALAQAIRLALLGPIPKDIDPAKLDEMIEQVTARNHPGLIGKPDEEWVAAVGMNRRQWGILHLQVSFLSTRLAKLMHGIPSPDEKVLADWWSDRSAEWGRQGHVHMLIWTARGPDPEQAAEATRLVRQCDELIRDGLPFYTLNAAVDADPGLGLKLHCMKDKLILDMQPRFARVLKTLEPGQSTPVFEVNQQRMMMSLQDWNEIAAPSFGEAKGQITALWKSEEGRRIYREELLREESRASIETLEDGNQAKVTESAFERCLAGDPASAVGTLGLFWQKARAGDPEAGTLLDVILDLDISGPKGRAQLADALAKHGLAELAGRCRK